MPQIIFASLPKVTTGDAEEQTKQGYFEETIVVKDLGLGKEKKVKLNGLGLQKKAESEKKWTECINLAKANVTAFAEVRAWILVSWLKCAREMPDDKTSIAVSQKALLEADKIGGVGTGYVWSNSLNSEIIRTRFSVLDKMAKIKSGNIWLQLEALWKIEEILDKNQKAKLHFIAGENAQGKGDLRAALSFFQNSLNEAESKQAREKVNAVLLALNEVKESEKKEESIVEAEGGYEDRFKASTKANDLISLLEDCISYLKHYPGGKRAKWANDKVLEIYFGIFDQLQVESLQDKYKDLRERALSAMENTDALRLSEWARVLHKRIDLEGGLRLAEKSLDRLSEASSSATLVYVAGRSAQMSGDYRKAKKYFELYVDQFSGSEDLPEVTFRLGLTYLRMGLASSAIATLEKLLTLRGIDKFELSSKYWLARSYQATNNTKALSAIDDILQKYPFSYYGLRLRMERASGLLEWPTPLKIPNQLKASFYSTQSHRQAYKRMQLLAQQEWFFEATQELANIPLPKDRNGKLALAKKLADLGLFPRVVRMVNELGDQDSEMRSLDVVSLALPNAFKLAIEEQSGKNKLSPILVKSLIRQESAFGPRAVSTSNAYGLMQIIGPTAQEVAGEIGLKGISVPEDVYQPETNIQMGTYYLAKMIRQYGGNVPFGLAAYNAGPHRLKFFVYGRKEVSQQLEKHSSDPLDEMWFDELPWFETSFYVKAILRNVIMYKLADRVGSGSPDERRVQFESIIWNQLANN